jgi:hypothetical protein
VDKRQVAGAAEVREIPTPHNGYGIAVAEPYAYIADGYTGIIIYDISDPLNPYIITTVDTPGSAWNVDIVGRYAYVADNSRIQIIDLLPEN